MICVNSFLFKWIISAQPAKPREKVYARRLLVLAKWAANFLCGPALQPQLNRASAPPSSLRAPPWAVRVQNAGGWRVDALRALQLFCSPQLGAHSAGQPASVRLQGAQLGRPGDSERPGKPSSRLRSLPSHSPVGNQPPTSLRASYPSEFPVLRCLEMDCNYGRGRHAKLLSMSLDGLGHTKNERSCPEGGG